MVPIVVETAHSRVPVIADDKGEVVGLLLATDEHGEPLVKGRKVTAVTDKQVKELGWKRALVIDGAQVNENFAKAAQNIQTLDVLPSMGANVYDILKSDTLVLTKAGVAALEARLK